jgi:thiopeptide-type bacteriocin biosynthesis protein
MDFIALVMVTADDLLAGLGLTEEQRLEWYREMVPSLHESGAAYRQKKAQFRLLLGSSKGLLDMPGGELVRDTLVTWKTTLTLVARQLSEARCEEQLRGHLSTLYRSYVHMHCNRMGLDREKEQEVLQLLLRTREGLVCSPVVSSLSSS